MVKWNRMEIYEGEKYKSNQKEPSSVILEFNQKKCSCD